MKKAFKPQLWWFLVPFTIALILICFLPYLFTQFTWVSFDLSKYGTLGDAMNGLMGPFIAMLAAGLTFAAFWIQYKANEQQREDIEFERFETNFYELVRLHKANVDEINIADQMHGRKAFSALYNELRFTYFVVEKVIDDFILGSVDDKKIEIGFPSDDKKSITVVAYLLFFYGTGSKSNKLLIESLKGFCTLDFINRIGLYVEGLKSKYKQSKTKTIVVKRETYQESLYSYTSKYTPFEGHAARLGHYYRHLYQTVKYVDEASLPKEFQRKYGYIKTLRAQLSNYEQILLFYNAQTPLGSPWITIGTHGDSLIVRYKMIKNMPLPIVDFGIDPIVYFHDAIEYYRAKSPPEEFFEWHELKNNA